ncbi:MAG: glycosyltransferase family 2 protein [Candidatus Lokiarchaeota archaeon]|nr:glycosyltransferase family 2 protein [Candidatus Lokiarchaeota archaeon]
MSSHKTPKDYSFSVFIANYNNERFIGTAINSIISQTYQNWELVIVDDGSTDDSVKVIKSFLKDKRIKLIALKENFGVGYSKKMGADNCQNDIIGVLDADDKIHEETLEVIVNAYKDNPDCGFIYTSMYRCDSELKNCKIDKRVGEIIPPKTSIFNYKISMFRTFLRKVYQNTSGYDPKLKAAVDRDIIYKLEEVTNFKFINKPLYYYRKNEQGVSQGKNEYAALYQYYLARCKAYLRRLNTDIPNLKKRDIKLEYYKLKLYKFIKFLRKYSDFADKVLETLPFKIKVVTSLMKFLRSV